MFYLICILGIIVCGAAAHKLYTYSTGEWRAAHSPVEPLRESEAWSSEYEGYFITILVLAAVAAGLTLVLIIHLL